MIYEYAVISAGHIKGNGLICLLGAGSAVVVPYVYGLTVLYEGGEFFTKSVNVFAYGNIEHFTHYGRAACGASRVKVFALTHECTVVGAPVRFLDIGCGAPAALGEELSVVHILYVPCSALSADNHACFAGSEGIAALCILFNVGLKIGFFIKLKIGGCFFGALKMFNRYLNGIFEGRGEVNGKKRTAQGLSSIAYPLSRRQNGDRFFVGGDLVHLGCVTYVIAGLVKPESVRVFHCVLSFLFCFSANFILY